MRAEVEVTKDEEESVFAVKVTGTREEIDKMFRELLGMAMRSMGVVPIVMHKPPENDEGGVKVA